MPTPTGRNSNVSNRLPRGKVSLSRTPQFQNQAKTRFWSRLKPSVSIPLTSAVSRSRSVLSEDALLTACCIYLAHYFLPNDGAYIGCDLAGEVVKLGRNLKVDLKVGDPISASVAGGKHIKYRWAPSTSFLTFEMFVLFRRGERTGRVLWIRQRALRSRLEDSPGNVFVCTGCGHRFPVSLLLSIVPSHKVSDMNY